MPDKSAGERWTARHDVRLTSVAAVFESRFSGYSVSLDQDHHAGHTHTNECKQIRLTTSILLSVRFDPSLRQGHPFLAESTPHATQPASGIAVRKGSDLDILSSSIA
jgi:hypothetical protein